MVRDKNLFVPVHCEGTCCAECFGGTVGPGRRYRVTGKDGTDWGFFTYCDEAVADDESRGFTVERDRPADAIWVFDGDGPPCAEFPFCADLVELFEQFGFDVVSVWDECDG